MRPGPGRPGETGETIWRFGADDLELTAAGTARPGLGRPGPGPGGSGSRPLAPGPAKNSGNMGIYRQSPIFALVTRNTF